MVGTGLWKNSIFDILHDQPLRVSAASEYQFMNTDDVAKIVLALVRRQPKNDLFNVCGAGCIALARIAELAGKPAPRSVVENPRVERYEVNVEKLQSLASVPKTEATVRKFIPQPGVPPSDGRLPAEIGTSVLCRRAHNHIPLARSNVTASPANVVRMPHTKLAGIKCISTRLRAGRHDARQILAVGG